MNIATRVLPATDPARDLQTTLDQRAEAELALLLGPTPSTPIATQPAPRSQPVRRLRPFLVTAVVGPAVTAITIAVLVATPNSRNDAGHTPASPSPAATHAGVSALALVKQVWRVEDAVGESGSTWLRFRGHDVQVLRAGTTLEFGWRAQGDQLMFSPDDHGVSRGGADTVRWLEDSTAFRPAGNRYELTNSQGTITARLVADNTAPEAPITITKSIRADLADAQPGPVRQVTTTALHGTWALTGDSRHNAQVTFHTNGTWTTTEHCTATGAPDTNTGGYRLTTTGFLLATIRTGQALTCLDTHANRATTSTLTLLLQGHSVRIDNNTATIYDRRGTILGHLTRL